MNAPLTTTTTTLSAARARAEGTAVEAVESLVAQLRSGLDGRVADVVLWFASAGYDPEDLAGPISAAFPGAAVLGCSTAGEFTDAAGGVGGITATALPHGLISHPVVALGDLSEGVAAGTKAAVATIEAELGTTLRELDPSTYVGIVLIDGMHGDEEAVNAALGDAAPLLDIVGGSAGDDLAFADTWVAVGDAVSHRGVALLVGRSEVPFRIVRTCSFVPLGRTVRITRSDAATRTVWELDGRPALEVYAEAVGVSPEEVDAAVFMRHPLGVVVDGAPFIRSPQQLVADGGIRFYCEIHEGMDVEVMTNTDLVAETRAALASVREELGGSASAGIMFNCILRRLELDADDAHEAFLEALGGIPAAGFHSYGESWMGHMNQTLTAVVFG